MIYVPPPLEFAPPPRPRFDWERLACIALALIFMALAAVGFFTIVAWGLGD